MREKMVTRSMKVTEAQVLMVNLDSQQTSTIQVDMPNTYKDDSTLMKALVKVYDGTDNKPVHVISTNIKERLYGMSEKTFLENAQELDPETRKALKVEAEAEA